MQYFDVTKRIESAELVREQMWPYQNMAVWFCKNYKKVALWLDLGLGKTAIAATVAVDLLAELEVNRVLIIGPLRVANMTWPEQLAEWKHTAGFNYTVLSAEPESRKETKTSAVIRRSKESKNSIHIVNMEMVGVLVDHWRRKWPYDLVIIDESSKFKDHSSQRFKKLMLVYDYIEYMIQLTATPASEGYMGLFAQIALLDKGDRLGKTITDFRTDYCSMDPYTRKWSVLKAVEPVIDKKIHDVTLVMTASDYLPDFKKPHFVEHKLSLTPEYYVQQKAMERDSILQIGDTEIIADNAAAVWSKMLQMASGMVYETWKEPHPTRVGKMQLMRKAHHLHDEKLDELEALIDQLDGKPLLLAYYWEESLERLKKRFPKAVMLDKDGKFKKRWDAGKIPLLIAHPQSAAHGLNLQKPTNQVGFFDLHPSLENFLQFIGRVNRQGQKEKVLVHLFLAKGTYDMRVWESLKNKEDGERAMLERIRGLQRRQREKILAQINAA